MANYDDFPIKENSLWDGMNLVGQKPMYVASPVRGSLTIDIQAPFWSSGPFPAFKGCRNA
jgi:hypothetical protein